MFKSLKNKGQRQFSQGMRSWKTTPSFPMATARCFKRMKNRVVFSFFISTWKLLNCIQFTFLWCNTGSKYMFQITCSKLFTTVYLKTCETVFKHPALMWFLRTKQEVEQPPAKWPASTGKLPHITDSARVGIGAHPLDMQEGKDFGAVPFPSTYVGKES